MELLRDPLWQFAGAALALLTILATFYLFWLQRQRKSLSYEVISSTNLLSISETIKDTLEVRRNGVPIPGLHLIVIRLTNTGNVPITTTDYETPITFSFKEAGIVLEAQITTTRPKNIKATMEFDPTSVRLSPSLLNPKDSIELKILLTRFSGQVSVEGRIIGVSHIKEIGVVPNYDLAFAMMMSSGIIGVFSGLYLVLALVIIKVANMKNVAEWPAFLLLGLFLHFVLLLIIYQIQSKALMRWSGVR